MGIFPLINNFGAIEDPMSDEPSKHCTKCKQTKPLSQFNRNRARYDGVSVYCKSCMKLTRDEWRKTPDGRKKHNAQFQRWKAQNRDHYLELERDKDKGRRSQPIPVGKTLICRHCGRSGGAELFPKSVMAKFKTTGDCRDCRNNRRRELQVQRKGQPRTYDFRRFTGNLYTTQRKSSKERGHSPPEYTLEQFRTWVQEQSGFEGMVERWVASGFQLPMKPTVDRVNPLEPYRLDNIQLVTVRKNNQKARFDAQVVYTFMSRLYDEGSPQFKERFHRHLSEMSKKANRSNIYMAFGCQEKTSPQDRRYKVK